MTQLTERERILQCWWMLELFSPQKIPKLTPPSKRLEEQQVIEWQPDEPLPWEVLKHPKSFGGKPRAWKHTIFLGVYDLETTYQYLHRAFTDDQDAYDERSGGKSACAGVVVNERGFLVDDSPVLSSALWAVGQIDSQVIRGHVWAEGFPDATEEFRNAVSQYEGRRAEANKSESAPAQNNESLREMLRIAHRFARIDGNHNLATNKIVIKSVAVSSNGGEGSTDTDFLNSFFLDDLTNVREDVVDRRRQGSALDTYLAGDSAVAKIHRVDVMGESRRVDEGMRVERLPKGRWPSDPSHSLSLRQQFAVNNALADLAPTSGIMGVNGPPGTGKTTMLRDILAGNVVERARRLADLSTPDQAFTETTHSWKAGAYVRKVRQLRSDLTGFEMVVASANNAAVENVTTEIPARDAIHSLWRKEANYFAEIASALLDGEDSVDTAQTESLKAWGLVAAKLGNKANRSQFRSEFWFDKDYSDVKEAGPGAVPRMQTLLTQWRDGKMPYRSWDTARKDFREVEKKVDGLIRLRWRAQERLAQVQDAIAAKQQSEARVVQALKDVEAAERRLCDGESFLAQTENEVLASATSYERQLRVRPGLLESLVTFGRAVKEWRANLEPLTDRLQTAEGHRQQAAFFAREQQDQIVRLRSDLATAEDSARQAISRVADLRHHIADDEQTLGGAHPSQLRTAENRELRAPWIDAELDAARSELFLAALQLHEDFLANNATEMLKGLRAAVEVVAGVYPRDLEPEKLRAAWQLFFLVVPMVSTTFASVGRMFGRIGPEALGWLLIDEAGQASPQYAAGAIWRSQRVVVVGDPLQLQPVVTIPKKAQRDIAAAYGVSETWLPPRASAQTLADRVSSFGTMLQQQDQHIWVSAPLTVHRRCDDPMFTLCNTIAYNSIMVDGVKRKLISEDQSDKFDGPNGPSVALSHWADEPARTSGTHFQENQINRLERGLAYLKECGVPMEDLIAISPFRAVADRLESLSAKYPGLQGGTIHTAQGREASVVFLVLGGDPSAPGAKVWAASTVNLVNVAVSRAKRRLYVIGDRNSWEKHNYFRQLSSALRV